jgi:hypothetical protein
MPEGLYSGQLFGLCVDLARSSIPTVIPCWTGLSWRSSHPSCCPRLPFFPLLRFSAGVCLRVCLSQPVRVFGCRVAGTEGGAAAGRFMLPAPHPLLRRSRLGCPVRPELAYLSVSLPRATSALAVCAFLPFYHWIVLFGGRFPR